MKNISHTVTEVKKSEREIKIEMEKTYSTPCIHLLLFLFHIFTNISNQQLNSHTHTILMKPGMVLYTTE